MVELSGAEVHVISVNGCRRSGLVGSRCHSFSFSSLVVILYINIVYIVCGNLCCNIV